VRHRLRPVFALTLAAVAVSAAACGGGSSPSSDSGATPATQPAQPKGDAAAGKAVFKDSGCGRCHALADADAHGSVGPDLDLLKPSFATVRAQVEQGGGGMPSFADDLTAQQIADVAAYVSSVTHR
jgi:mono/diheme cytochrome c family protein